jgi:biopolymer transport protein TolQ
MHHVIYGYLVTMHRQQPAPGPAAHSLNIGDLVMQATLPVKGVMLILTLFIIACWYIIGYKWLYLRRAFAENESFLLVFEETRQLNVAAEAAAQRPRSPVAQMYRAGYDELLRVKAAAGLATTCPAASRTSSAPCAAPPPGRSPSSRAWCPSSRRWAARRPSSASSARCTASCTPSCSCRPRTGTSTIDRVGPGIAEALFATAIGLVAAIPAVIGYNYFTRQIRVIHNEMEIFGNDFLNIVRRHILK